MPSLFDLPGFMFSWFGRVEPGGDLFFQWPVGHSVFDWAGSGVAGYGDPAA